MGVGRVSCYMLRRYLSESSTFCFPARKKTRDDNRVKI